MKIGLIAVAAIIFVTHQAHAQGCQALLDTALSLHQASEKALQSSDSMKDVAMARFQRGADFQEPTQMAFTKLIESRDKMAEALATVNRANQTCGNGLSEGTSVRLIFEESLETIKGMVNEMRKAAPQLGVKLQG